MCDLSPGAVIADIGAGSGLFTQGLLQKGYRVVAVEPNAAMRKASDHLLGHFPEYCSAAGCAESIPLEDTSVDLITAAQAFHWFEVDKARPECLRVLRPEGKVALIWNDRVLDDPLHKALDAILDEFGGEKRSVLVAHEERSCVPEFFGKTMPPQFSWPHEHILNEDGFVSSVFSRSYIPERNSPSGEEIDRRVRQLFNRFSSNSMLAVRYSTVAIVGRPG